MSGEILVDDSRFPLMTVTFTGATSDAQFEVYLTALTRTTHRALREKRRVAFVMDSRKVSTTPPSQRRLMGDWMKKNDEATRATCAGFAFVMESAIQRGLLTAVLWIHPLPAPHLICASLGDAAAWCREQLAKDEPVGAFLAL